jgi:hypothetical protein
MILISHRGNINGKNNSLENNPNYIDKAIYDGYEVEVDIWNLDNKIYLGHDTPEYEVDMKWILDRQNKLWIHCKNIGAIELFSRYNGEFHFYWHDNDTMTITSKKYIWVLPGKQPIENSIAVLPELHNDDISRCIGICSDYVEKYRNMNE